MGSMILPAVLAQQPQQFPVIDWSNPITEGLVAAYVCGSVAMGWSYDSPAEIPYMNTGGSATGTPIVTPMGTAVRTTGASSYSFQINQNRIKSSNYSLFAVGTGTASQTQSAIDDDDGNNRRFQFRIASGKAEFIPFTSGGNGDVLASTALTAAQLANGFTMGATASTSQAVLYQNRQMFSSSLTGILTPNSMLNVGSRKTGSQLWNVGGLLLLLVFNVTKSPAEMFSLADNPWQIFKALQRRIWVPVPAGGTNGNASVQGAAAASAAGPMTAMGSAIASVFGAMASSQVGAILASAAGNATVPGSSATGQASPASASGNAGANPVGAQATSSASPIAATGTASASLAGAPAYGQVGAVSPTGSANAAPSGASATGQAGTVTAAAGGNANVTIPGVAAMGRAGTVTASGNALAVLTGASAATGTAPAEGSGGANSTPVGVAAFSGVGAIAGAGTARASVAGVVATAQTGTVTATGSGDGSAVATVQGAAATASVGQITATGVRTGIEVNITEDMICKVVRDYIKSIAPPTMRVLRTPVNKASMPNGPYVSFTPGLRMPLSTNISGGGTNSRSVRRPEQMAFQIDCYGEGSADLAETLNTLFRDAYAVELFARSGLEITPLYAGDIQQAPFTNDADQYEDRYLFEIDVQVNSVIVVPQQTSNTLNIDLISVDADFPPIEVE